MTPDYLEISVIYQYWQKQIGTYDPLASKYCYHAWLLNNCAEELWKYIWTWKSLGLDNQLFLNLKFIRNAIIIISYSFRMVSE